MHIRIAGENHRISILLHTLLIYLLILTTYGRVARRLEKSSSLSWSLKISTGTTLVVSVWLLLSKRFTAS